MKRAHHQAFPPTPRTGVHCEKKKKKKEVEGGS
ncbi:hypothetical protein E2C01_054745 [Portunus trituberculatus]|uniref:Uncharacterized protein n=1 Tax=Portunus trituberculatus TaxID=210409 RepID=A0A5B7GKG9_PORTR|nr:hypothetical protein [Portunus trituberculatus]